MRASLVLRWMRAVTTAKAHLGGEKGGFPQTTWGVGHRELDARGSAIFETPHGVATFGFA
jgi:hypothetical protein